MVRERPLTDFELDAALNEALIVDPSPDFLARVREKLAGEEISGSRPFPFVLATVTLVAAAMVFAIVMLERQIVEQPRVPVAAAIVPSKAITASDAPAAVAASAQPAHETSRRPETSRRLQRIQVPVQEEPGDVLIPAAEQQALRRLLERPPTAVLRFAPSVDPTAVAAIAIPPLSIDPLSPQGEEGGHQ
jgi:hypothetical protein